jgi:hypothetical protein
VAHRWGVILGTLGRQGNPAILTRVTDLLRGKEVFIMLLSEITPQKVHSFGGRGMGDFGRRRGTCGVLMRGTMCCVAVWGLTVLQLDVMQCDVSV